MTYFGELARGAGQGGHAEAVQVVVRALEKND